MKIIRVLLVFISLNFNLFAQQTYIDSLKNITNSAEHDSTIIKNYFLIGEAYKYNLPDSAIAYFNKALEHTEKSSESFSYQWYKWNIYKGLGFAYNIKSEFKKSIDSYQKQIAIALSINDADGICRGYNNLGVVYQNIGNYTESFAYYLKAIKIAEKKENNWMLGLLNNNIGTIYLQHADFEKCIEYCKKALSYYSIINDSLKMAHSYANLGSAYANTGMYDSSLYYLHKSNSIFKNTNFVNELAINQRSEAFVNINKRRYYDALENYDKAFNYQKQLGKTIGLADILSNKALVYITLYNNGDKNESYLKEAKKLGEMSLHIADSLNIAISKASALFPLLKIDSIMGNYKNAFNKTIEYLYIANAVQGPTTINNMENRYLMEKKQQEITLLEAQSALDAERSKRMQIVTTISSVGVAILIFLIVIIIRKLKQTQYQKSIIQEQKDTVESKNKLLNEQNEEITTQKEIIEKHRKSMIDSITYAERIQQAVLPKFPSNNNMLDHFILFQPKDIVSGDFYWFSKIDDKLIFTVADCTGHGVPGGFMSMLGVSFLNEIVNEQNKLLSASKILERLREMVISALKQRGASNEAKDGMDIALCILDTSTNKLQFAGAFNTLLTIPADGSGIQAIKGDRQPIAYYNKMRPFTNHEIQLHKGDCIYLTSDGFKDQFDADGNKFGMKRLQNLLESISNKIMDQQKVELELVLRVWLQDVSQIDDITVMGLRV